MVPSAYCGRWAGDKRPIFVWFKIELQRIWLSGGPERVRNQRYTCKNPQCLHQTPFKEIVKVRTERSMCGDRAQQLLQPTSSISYDMHPSLVTTNQMMFSTCLQWNLLHLLNNHSLHSSRDLHPPVYHKTDEHDSAEGQESVHRGLGRAKDPVTAFCLTPKQQQRTIPYQRTVISLLFSLPPCWHRSTHGQFTKIIVFSMF